MNQKNELMVGLTVIVAIVVVIAAVLFLGDMRPGGADRIETARFRTVGGLSVGNPVVLRGVRVGRVEAVRLAADDWVETDLRISADAVLPDQPVAIAASASLFGEWLVSVLSSERAPDDPQIQLQLDEARTLPGDIWPGATLPDIGQLTAQASRIASDVATVTERVGGLVDSATIEDLRQSVAGLRRTADQLVQFTDAQTASLGSMFKNAATSSEGVLRATGHLEATLSRVDSSTASGELADLLTDARAAAGELRSASANVNLVAGTAADQRENLAEVMTSAARLMERLERGEGTLGLLTSDSTLYREATLTVVQLRSLISDIQANPRRYFRFSVF